MNLRSLRMIGCTLSTTIDGDALLTKKALDAEPGLAEAV
jgi:hypothetical protein